MKTKLILALLVLTAFFSAAESYADTLLWRGPTHTLTIGLNQDDISHVEFPTEIVNVTVENSEYVDILVVQGYGNRAFRMRSLLPKMATRAFLTDSKGQTYIIVLTTDVPYRSFLKIEDGRKVDAERRKVASKFGANDLIRAMAEDRDIPGVLRETYVIPDWFKGSGLNFELSEVWQTPKFTGLVVHVQNEAPTANEVNLPAINIPKTSEWGILRHASMENMRLAPKGRPNDKGVMFLIFAR